jgi:hypothetical protein
MFMYAAVQRISQPGAQAGGLSLCVKCTIEQGCIVEVCLSWYLTGQSYEIKSPPLVILNSVDFPCCKIR